MSIRDLFKMKSTSAVVVSCMDFRFQRFVLKAVRETFGIENPDYVSLPGGVYQMLRHKSGGFHGRIVILEAIELSVAAHGAKRVILLNHQDCGKYAEAGFSFSSLEEESTFHTEELMKASSCVCRHFPGLEVLLGFVVIKDGRVQIVRIK